MLKSDTPAGWSGNDGPPPLGVTRGLDPRVHLLRENIFAKRMDCRVRPGNDI
jgi:hypothetical protein